MSCYHPLRAIRLSDIRPDDPYAVSPSTGKGIVKILNPNIDYGSKLWNREECFSVPCGQCIGCRLDRSRDWANRCMLELQYHRSAYFVTLTYNDEHVPRSYYSDPETGEAFESLTLVPRDLQLFFKRLRKKVGKIRYFACGEYGDQTMRPHYHAIIFGLELYDLIPWSRNELGQQYYRSPFLEEVWSIRKAPTRHGSVNILCADPEYFFEPIGHVCVAEVSWETCAYVARYCTKKLTGPMAQFYSNLSIEPPFCRMSRKPGIAYQFYEDHPDMYDFDKISISTPTGGRSFRPPRYFDKLYDIDHPDEMAEIKVVRARMAKEAEKAKISRSSLSVDEILSVAEYTKKNSIKALHRPL